MGCRIGMSTNVQERFEQLKQSGKIPDHATYRILTSSLTYDSANDFESEQRSLCSRHGLDCQGHSGGQLPSGVRRNDPVWKVYRIDW